MLLAKFKKLVDETSPTLHSRNLDEAYRILELGNANSQTAIRVTDKIYSNINLSVSLSDKSVMDEIKRFELMNLRDELIYRYVLLEENPIDYLKIISVINDSCRKDCNYFRSLDETENWKKAIENCKNFHVFSPSIFLINLENIRKDYPKQFDIATSVKYLVENGCSFEINNSEIIITEGFDLIASRLELMIKDLGGLVLIKSLFSHLALNKQYSQRFERYFMPRKTSGLGYKKTPEIPYGYLINVAIKYPYENIKVKKSQIKLNEIIELAIIIINGAYGVQQYSIWENFFQKGDTIIKFCTDVALWDSLYNFPQSRPSTAIDITSNLFSYIENSIFEETLNFRKEELWEVVNEINKIESNPNQVTILYTSSLSKRLKHIDVETIKAVLIALSHNGKVNENYILPSDYIQIDFFLKPLLKISSTKFILLNKSLCAPNYFESLASHFRGVLKAKKRDLDNELGLQLELFLQNKLNEKGIEFCTGNYKINGIEGECDLLIETDESIVLIEFKKKPLTRKAKSGVDINILLDLVESVFHAQIQAGRTEIFLREEEFVILTSNKNEKFRIELKGRKIERIALTQLEFGGFQDRTIINSFLKSFLTHSFDTNSKESAIIKKFSKLSEKQKVWVEQYDKLIVLDKSFEHFPFFNCWFLSLLQLLEIINISTDNNSFYDNLKNTKFITMSTLDWYFEFNYSSDLKSLETKT